MATEPDPLDQQCRISEITFLPDGRICVFGMSEQLLEVFDQLSLGDDAIRQRIAQVRLTKAARQRETCCQDRPADGFPGEVQES